jgi:hypothetical protein
LTDAHHNNPSNNATTQRMQAGRRVGKTRNMRTNNSECDATPTPNSSCKLISQSSIAFAATYITMKVTAILILASIASVSHALVAPDRRAFLAKASAASAAAFVAAANSSPAFAKDEYSTDFDQVVVPKKEKVASSGGNGGLLIGGVLAGGLALSLPFFGQNLARMGGVKNAKLPKK